MKFDIITIFPEIFKSFLGTSLISRALKKKIISVKAHDLRKWTSDSHKTVDGRPYGGGPGMVMMVRPILKSLSTLRKNKIGKQKTRVILFSAKGKRFTQSTARRLAKYQNLVLICGRYEGVDERVAKYIADEEISIGDYVLFGGEVPAMVVVEAVSRLVPGIIAKEKSVEEESFKKIKKSSKTNSPSFIEYPHFTRPESIKIKGKNRLVPKVLLTGNHQKIKTWRDDQARGMAKKRKKLNESSR